MVGSEKSNTPELPVASNRHVTTSPYRHH
jgi:hypothetical protein